MDSGLAALKGLSVEGLASDQSKKSDREALVKHIADKYGKLDVLIANAAVGFGKP